MKWSRSPRRTLNPSSSRSSVPTTLLAQQQARARALTQSRHKMGKILRRRNLLKRLSPKRWFRSSSPRPRVQPRKPIVLPPPYAHMLPSISAEERRAQLRERAQLAAAQRRRNKRRQQRDRQQLARGYGLPFDLPDFRESQRKRYGQQRAQWALTRRRLKTQRK